MEHYCHVKSCTRKVHPRFLMCPPHWKLVPPEMQRRVWRLYRPGQEVTKDPSPEYLAAAREACAHVEAMFREEVHAPRLGSTFKGNPSSRPADPEAVKRLKRYIDSPEAARTAAQQARAEKAAREKKQTKLF